MDKLPFNPNAVWISYSALEEYYSCPKSYYYRYLYKNPGGLRVTIANPYLTKGNIVDLTVKHYFDKNEQVSLDQLLWFLDFQWKLKSGKAGGFTDSAQETIFKEKANKMIGTFYNNIKAVAKKAEVPAFLETQLFTEGDVRLCGTPDLIDNLEDGTTHIIDVKTGENLDSTYGEEISLQLPIYKYLVENVLGKKVSKASYWHLALHEKPVEVHLPDKDYFEDIKFKTQPILKARTENSFQCLKGDKGCIKCNDFTFITKGLAEVVGRDKNRVVYFVDRTKEQSLYSDDLPF